MLRDPIKSMGILGGVDRTLLSTVVAVRDVLHVLYVSADEMLGRDGVECVSETKIEDSEADG